MTTEKTYQPLYLKYRPQSLAEIVGQQSVVRTLTNAIENDRISHAYLFTGPRGTGKTSSARILAKSLNCQNGPTVNPCMECASCQEIKLGTSPSVFEIDAASNNSVDDARTLIERAPLVAQGGRFKLYIIDECHMLTKEAFNALLKTIEEPPPKVIFILATTEEHKVPPTIISRCQRLMFRLVEQQELSKHLRNVSTKESIEIVDEALDLVARRSGGGLRDALGLLDQASLLSAPGKPVGIAELLTLLGAVQEDVLLKLSAAIQQKDGHVVLGTINELLHQGREPSVLIVELAKHFLNLAKASYVVASSGESADIRSMILGSKGYIESLIEQAKLFDRAELTQIVEQLDKLEQTIKRSSQPSLNLEMGLLSVCHRHDILMMKELSERVQKLEQAIADGNLPMPSQAVHSAGHPAGHSAGYPAGQPAGHPAGQPPVKISVLEQQPQSSAPRPDASHPQSAQPQTAHQEAPPQAAEHRLPPELSDEENEVYYADEPAESSTPPQQTPAHHDAESPVEQPSYQSPPQQSLVQQAPPQHATAAQEYAQSASASSGATGSGGSKSRVELDELWSDLLRELHNISVPTFSLAEQQAFLVSLDADDLVVGVMKETFQKMIENKTEHIKSAYTRVVGRTPNVKVKVMAEAQTAAQRSQPRERSKREEQPSRGTGDSDEYEPAGRSTGTLTVERPRQEAYASPASESDSYKRVDEIIEPHTRPSAPEQRPEQRPQQRAEASRPAEATRPNPRIPSPATESGGSSLIREAYKLFEGPGSRLIS